jgi:hypothetical protein
VNPDRRFVWVYAVPYPAIQKALSSGFLIHQTTFPYSWVFECRPKEGEALFFAQTSSPTPVERRWKIESVTTPLG